MKQLLLVLVLSAGFFQSCRESRAGTEGVRVPGGSYAPDWASLSQVNESPEWFADSKLGVYFHWGPYAVPAFSSEWYPRNMYIPGHEAYEHHRATFGDQTEFGYHDFIPLFRAEHFDAEEWADVIAQSGARWAGPVAQHHDGYAMWDSELNPWNVGDTGPRRDITGELATAIRARGMKLITSFHHARNLQRNAADRPNWAGWSSHYPYNPAWATASEDDTLRWLYGNVPAQEWYPYWFAQIQEVIDKYDPDIIWFDAWLGLIPEQYRQEFCAYYLNHAAAAGKEVVIAHKNDNLPLDVSILDIEQGGKRDGSERVWLTDVTLSDRSWSYVDGQRYKSAAKVLRNLIDVVSKNGIVLLNISPRADGTIPTEQQRVLREIGDWLNKYGESIYGTRPWGSYGFGTTQAKDGWHGGQSADTEYTAGDVRLTQAKDGSCIYVHFLGAPERGKRIDLKTFKRTNFPPKSPVKRATVLGSGTELDFAFNDIDSYIVLPDEAMDEIATVVKLELAGAR